MIPERGKKITKDVQRTHGERAIQMTQQKEKKSNAIQKDPELSPEDLIKKYNLLEEFVFSFSHDLKTPIISILGIADMMMKETQDNISEEHQYYLKRIRENSLSVLERIDQILIFSQDGKIQRTQVALDLNSIMKKSVSNYLSIIKERKIDITILERNSQVNVDKNEITFVFDNLIGNSIKYMGDQTHPNITVGIQGNSDQFVTVFVKDNGMGIPQDSLTQVFQMFSRASNVPSDISGSGIGLARVKRIIDSYGGKIWIESQEGKGTTVFFSLPSYNE